MRILLLPPREALREVRDDPEWGDLLGHAQVDLLPVGPETSLIYGLEPGLSVPRCLELARSCAGRYDFVVGNFAGAFLWRAIFGLAGVDTPFAIMPRYNHVAPEDAFAATLAAQWARPEDVVFAGSRAAATSFGFFGFPCRADYPLGLHPTFRRLTNPREELRRERGLSRDRLLLIYTGRVEPDKEVLTLLEAVRMLKRSLPIELIICCNSYRSRYLQACLKRADAIGDVHFLESVARPALTEFYNAADLFVTAAVSRFETFGRSPVEALACGIPSVAPAFDGFRDTMEDVSACRLVPTRMVEAEPRPDLEGLVAAIGAQLTSPTDREGVARTCLLAAARFERQRSLRSLVEVLRDRPIRTTPPLGDRPFSVRDCAPCIQDLFADLEGRSSATLLDGFVTNGALPGLLPEQRVATLHRTWFTHY
jgi:glycosyltransferase involved in cell wall biosynthesis